MNKQENKMNEFNNELILSWLPSQESDKQYPLKNVIIISYGSSGYQTTEWLMDRATIQERNAIQGITERIRILIDARSHRSLNNNN